MNSSEFEPTLILFLFQHDAEIHKHKLLFTPFFTLQLLFTSPSPELLMFQWSTRAVVAATAAFASTSIEVAR